MHIPYSHNTNLIILFVSGTCDESQNADGKLIEAITIIIITSSRLVLLTYLLVYHIRFPINFANVSANTKINWIGFKVDYN